MDIIYAYTEQACSAIDMYVTSRLSLIVVFHVRSLISVSLLIIV